MTFLGLSRRQKLSITFGTLLVLALSVFGIGYLNFTEAERKKFDLAHAHIRPSDYLTSGAQLTADFHGLKIRGELKLNLFVDRHRDQGMDYEYRIVNIQVHLSF